MLGLLSEHLPIQKSQYAWLVEAELSGYLLQRTATVADTLHDVFHHLDADILGKRLSCLCPHKVVQVSGREERQDGFYLDDTAVHGLLSAYGEISDKRLVQSRQIFPVDVGTAGELALIEADAVVQQQFQPGRYQPQAVPVDVTPQFLEDMFQTVLHDSLLLQG